MAQEENQLKVVKEPVVKLCNRNVVGILEWLLKEAKAGQLRSIYCAGKTSDSGILIGAGGCDVPHKFELIGHLLADSTYYRYPVDVEEE